MLHETPCEKEPRVMVDEEANVLRAGDFTRWVDRANIIQPDHVTEEWIVVPKTTFGVILAGRFHRIPATHHPMSLSLVNQ